MNNFLTFCLLLVFLSLISLNESKSFVHHSSSFNVKYGAKKASPLGYKKTASSQLQRGQSLERALALRGGGIESLDWRFFVAGSICAAFSHGITTPIGKHKQSKIISFT